MFGARFRRDWPEARVRKFRQAAFVYLHVAVLYEALVWTLWKNGIFHEPRGPVWIWLIMGGAVGLLVFWALWSLRNEWVARAVWAINAFRIPSVLSAAFLPGHGALPPALYITALVVVLGNMWFLARAAWDL